MVKNAWALTLGAGFSVRFFHSFGETNRTVQERVQA